MIAEQITKPDFSESGFFRFKMISKHDFYMFSRFRQARFRRLNPPRKTRTEEGM